MIGIKEKQKINDHKKHIASISLVVQETGLFGYSTGGRQEAID